MRKILYITLIILFLLPCANVFAGEGDLYSPESLKYTRNEEFRADWESEENARIMGESVVSSFRNGNAPGIKLNTLCSSASMTEISRIRGWFKSLIENEKRSGRVTEQSLLAAEILQKSAEYDITGLTEGEEILINSIKRSPVSEAAVKPGSLTGNGIPDEEIALIIPVTAINSTSKTIHFKSVLSNRYRSSSISSITPGRNFETAHADYYRLFLYMRDAAGDLFSFKNTYSFSPSNTQLFTSYISITQIRKLQKTVILQKGRMLPLATIYPLLPLGSIFQKWLKAGVLSILPFHHIIHGGLL